MKYHEESNDFELGKEDYYFSLQDTLAVSTLEIQADGSVLGKNLAMDGNFGVMPEVTLGAPVW